MGRSIFQSIFTNIQPFRQTLLELLAPFDISKLQIATGCTLSDWERETHMDLFDDVFEDNSDIALMKKLGMTIRVFGHDLDVMEDRLRDPLGHAEKFGDQKSFHIFVVVSTPLSGTNTTSVLLRDFRPEALRNTMPEDMTGVELVNNYSATVSFNVATLTKWILCAPYLSGSLSGAIPGWIPVFNARERVNVRAYISTFSSYNSRILHMDRLLIERVFGCENRHSLLSQLDKLVVRCITVNQEGTNTRYLRAKLTMNALSNIYAAAEAGAHEEQHMLVVNAVHPVNAAITFELN